MVVSLVVVGLMLVRVQRANDNGENAGKNLLQARTGFETKLTSIQRDEIAIPQPPAELFEVIQYDAPLGKNWAYLGKPENDSIKHPAIIWKFGGFSNRIGTTAWEAQPIRNDQSASAFRRRGVVMMYPSLRGGNGNPGQLEGLYGEVDDILAAADYLANQDFVDPNRIYLGGHSTGGTLVLLCAASSDQFRAVFSFGPVDDISGYGQDSLPFDISNANELLLRNPVNWIHAIKTPTFLFEGAYGNAESLHAMQQSNRNSNLHFYTIADKDHFEVLEPVTNLLAKKVVRDTARDCNIAITEEEIKTAFAE